MQPPTAVNRLFTNRQSEKRIHSLLSKSDQEETVKRVSLDIFSAFCNPMQRAIFEIKDIRLKIFDFLSTTDFFATSLICKVFLDFSDNVRVRFLNRNPVYALGMRQLQFIAFLTRENSRSEIVKEKLWAFNFRQYEYYQEIPFRITAFNEDLYRWQRLPDQNVRWREGKSIETSLFGKILNLRSTVKKVVLSVNMDDTKLIQLSEALCNLREMEHLEFHQSQFGIEGSNCIAIILSKAFKLHTLILSECFGDKENKNSIDQIELILSQAFVNLSNLTSVDLRDNQMSLTSIFQQLRNSSLRIIELAGNPIDMLGFRLLATKLQNVTKISFGNLCTRYTSVARGDKISGEGLKVFADELTSLNNLEEITFIALQSYYISSPAIIRTYSVVKKFSDDGIRAIAMIIAKSPNLKKLNLPRNDFTKEQWQILAESMIESSNIEHLDIEYCVIEDESIDTFKNFLKKLPRLKIVKKYEMNSNLVAQAFKLFPQVKVELVLTNLRIRRDHYISIRNRNRLKSNSE